MARRATIQLKVHRQLVQSIPLDDADIECMIQRLRLVTPCTQGIDRLIDFVRADARSWPAGHLVTTRVERLEATSDSLLGGDPRHGC
jgi:hypothetical protein